MPGKKNDKNKSSSSQRGASSSQRGASSSQRGASSSQRGASSSQKPSSSQAAASSQRQQSQASSLAQAERAASNFDQQEVDQKVNDLVQYLLITWQKNYPIKKLDINKAVLKEHRTAFAHIMVKAQEKLAAVFGVDVIELQDKLKGTFVLINRLENDQENPHLKWPEQDEAKIGLLMVILSLIYMNGNMMQDSEMWHALRKLGVDPDVQHPAFGDVKRLITQEFVRQGYLEHTRQQNVDPPSFDFTWGQRAFLETSKKNCLAFVSQIYDMEPKKWTSQYQDMINSEGPPTDEKEEAA